MQSMTAQLTQRLELSLILPPLDCSSWLHISMYGDEFQNCWCNFQVIFQVALSESFAGMKNNDPWTIQV